ncbi:MAG: accessory factor UbiK family protein [Luminiphilus sp.]|nr:accessory factor UbiK family protein [Luminiphilus sp.]MDG1684026.1 accessory factor UbiK family protein [Luminiphilus sp.]
MGQDDSNTRRPSSLFERLTQGENPLFNQIDRNAKSLLQSALSRLDVVSREEFDAQTAVLQRTRERLEALEKQIEMLDQTLETPPDTAGQ